MDSNGTMQTWVAHAVRRSSMGQLAKKTILGLTEINGNQGQQMNINVYV